MSDETQVIVPEENEPTTIDIADYESMGMTPSDMKAFFNWALGTSPEPPSVVQQMMVNLSAKLSVGLGVNIVGNIGRQTRLTKFLEEMERDIYDVKRIPDMSEKEKMATYKEARQTLSNIQEFQRKFIVQNKEFKPEGTEQEKLLGRIMALPNDQLAKVIAILDGDSSQNTVVADVSEDSILLEEAEEV